VIDKGLSRMPQSLAVLVIGDLFSPEMRTVERRVEELARGTGDVRSAAHVSEALAMCSAEPRHPDLVIVCQLWPDEYAAPEVGQLLEVFPLARLICCYGAWCGSDGRTRDIWPLSVRVPTASAARRIDFELEVLAGARGPLPLTASRDEIVLFDREIGIEAPAN
jgi:hypothetical protein